MQFQSTMGIIFCGRKENPHKIVVLNLTRLEIVNVCLLEEFCVIGL